LIGIVTEQVVWNILARVCTFVAGIIRTRNQISAVWNILNITNIPNLITDFLSIAPLTVIRTGSSAMITVVIHFITGFGSVAE